MKKMFLILMFLFANFSTSIAQTNQPTPSENPNYYPQSDPLQNISQETAKISKSVQSLNNSIKELLEKFMVGKGMQLTERQQKMLLGFEVLNRAEQRLEILQKTQIELTQKEGEVKTRLSQVDEELLPGSIERNTSVIGTTRSEELRDGRRKSFDSERRSLQTLLSQINQTLQQNAGELRQAQTFVHNLRRRLLPQIEAEISDL